MSYVIDKCFDVGQVFVGNLFCLINQFVFVIVENVVGQVVVLFEIIQVDVQEFQFCDYQFNFIVDNVVGVVKMKMGMVKFNCMGLRNVY